MFRVKADKNGELELIGEIDESGSFAKVIAQYSGDRVFKCLQVARINSVGFRSWREHFIARRNRGEQNKFKEVSPPLVEQISYDGEFMLREEVESICLPYMCERCKAPTIEIAKIDQIRIEDISSGSKPCPKCGGKQVFDDIPEEYIPFLK